MLDLPATIDERLRLFKLHLPYHESDHVLNIAYNALCDARCLQDHRNCDGRTKPTSTHWAPHAFPTPPRRVTSVAALRRIIWMLCRRRSTSHGARSGPINPDLFFEQAILDGDGAMVETDGECKQGMDISWKGQPGYHPLVISLANTGEVLRLVNRSGNCPSHEGAAAKFDESIALCRARRLSLDPPSWRHRFLSDTASWTVGTSRGTSPSASGWM